MVGRQNRECQNQISWNGTADKKLPAKIKVKDKNWVFDIHCFVVSGSDMEPNLQLQPPFLKLSIQDAENWAKGYQPVLGSLRFKLLFCILVLRLNSR